MMVEGKLVLVESKKEIPYCEMCSTSFSNRSSLKRHMNSKHKGYDDQNKERLVFGPNVFLVEKAQTRVSGIEEFVSEYVEGILDEIFKNKEIKFECQTCGKSFDSKRGLGAHKREVHIQPVPCDICNKKIKPGANMKKHMENLHNTPTKKPSSWREETTSSIAPERV